MPADTIAKHPLPTPLAALAPEIHQVIDGPWDGPTAPIDHLIARTLTAQRQLIQPWDAFLSASDISPDAPWWAQAAPPALSRHRLLFAGPEASIQQTFLSSGTTDPSRRAKAPYSTHGLDLMARAIDANARQMLFPDGLRTRILVLAPPPQAAPQMIMAWGMQRLMHTFGLEGSEFLIGHKGLDTSRLMGHFQASQSQGIPITLIGASFGFVHLLDGLTQKGVGFRLAEGSRTLDAGGFKGRSRELAPADLRAAISATLGIPVHRAINLLGMTELASQLYDDALGAAHDENKPLWLKTNPPWTRTVALDPASLEPLPHGETGLLTHLDLANLERPAAVRSADLGRTHVGGFEILGRARGEESAGCSLTVEAWLQ